MNLYPHINKFLIAGEVILARDFNATIGSQQFEDHDSLD